MKALDRRALKEHEQQKQHQAGNCLLNLVWIAELTNTCRDDT